MSLTRKELKRECCVCGKVTYNADTYGTRLREDKLYIRKYINKWCEYTCITNAYKKMVQKTLRIKGG